MSHPELAAEQAYVDHAYTCLERMRDITARAANATDQEVAALALEAWSARRLATFEDAERGLLFGRLDFEEVERPLYVGRRWVHDEERERCARLGAVRAPEQTADLGAQRARAERERLQLPVVV